MVVLIIIPLIFMILM